VEVFATGSAFDPAVAVLGDIDTAVILVRFASGALCSIDNSRRAVYGYDQRLEVFGSRGCLTVPNRTPTGVEQGDATGQHRDRLLHFFLDRYQESYVAEMQEFVERVRHGREAAVTGHDGLQAVVLALAARTSLQEGRAVHLDPATGLDAA
jgi:myo-inositol 2-dehydrogenase/D-chiro-inositol 1-dehydrogenase